MNYFFTSYDLLKLPRLLKISGSATAYNALINGLCKLEIITDAEDLVMEMEMEQGGSERGNFQYTD
jgi:pentatricopeptide repeat protein